MEDGNGAILPTWTAVDEYNVKTSRDLWESMRDQGWHVEVSVAHEPTSFRLTLTKLVFACSIIGMCFLLESCHVPKSWIEYLSHRIDQSK